MLFLTMITLLSDKYTLHFLFNNSKYIILFILTALAYYQHRGNIKKLLKGQERKTYIFKKNKVD